MNLYQNMDRRTLEREYSPSSCIEDIKVPIQQYIDQSQRVRQELKSQYFTRINYAEEERSVMDICVPEGASPFPVHVFIHGGYWQELSVNESTFAARNFLDHNIIFIALDYTLAPEKTLYEIIDQVKAGFLWIFNHIGEYGGDINNITLSGSSAGGHLAAEVLCMDWTNTNVSHVPFRGACSISGVFDLRPLVHTYVNVALGMNTDDAVALSPAFHLPKTACPMIFSYGGIETDEFKRQTRDFMERWREAGHSALFVEMPTFNHFDIVLDLCNKSSPLFNAILNQIMSDNISE
ncbi:MAG: alpha/beta hydrolase [Proteobacteria bacterium]|nr:alpha/beta hydrolase [Pseudomonadota bacterium]